MVPLGGENTNKQNKKKTGDLYRLFCRLMHVVLLYCFNFQQTICYMPEITVLDLNLFRLYAVLSFLNIMYFLLELMNLCYSQQD